MNDPEIQAQGLPDDERAADAQANAMKARMQQDVAAWSAGRVDAPQHGPPSSGLPSQTPATTRAVQRGAAPVSATQPASMPAKVVTGRTAGGKAAAPVVPATTARKPFAMKYDGMPAGRYAADRYDRGAR